MSSNIFTKAFKVAKNVISRKPKESVISSRLINKNTSTSRQGDFGSGNLAPVGHAVINRFSFKRGLVKIKQGLIKTKDKVRERLLCTQIALQSVPFKLPSQFVGDYGPYFPILLAECKAAKILNNPDPNNKTGKTKYTCTHADVKSHELWLFICANKHRSGHITQVFAHLSEEEVKQLPGDWLDLVVDERSLAKFLLDYASFNAPEHVLYLLKLGLSLSNVTSWLPRIFEDRIRLIIHSYRITTNNTLRITYEVPILVGPSGFASDLFTFFNVNILSFTLVIEFTFDATTLSYIKNSGTLITGFLHNHPYKADDIDTLRNVGPNNYYFGGTRGVAENYINTIGTKGMPTLKEPINFRILNLGVTPAARAIEAQFPNGLMETQVLQPSTNLMVPQKKHEKFAKKLENQPGYIMKRGLECEIPAITINRIYKQMITDFRNNGLVN